MFKAAVIGLGPAGASALKRLNELGIKAIAIERKKAPETPTVCGEFLPDPDVISFISRKPSVKKAFEYIGLASRLNTFNEIYLELEGVKTFRMNISGFTISRKQLVEKLIDGSEYVLDDDVVSIKRLSNSYIIKTRRGLSIEAEYIIGADGYPSSVRRLSGCYAQVSDEDVAVGINAKIETPEMKRNMIYMYASLSTPGGYAWIIPHYNFISNVGIGIRYNFIRQKGYNIIQLFQEFIKRNANGYLDNYKIIEPPRARWIPVSGFYGSPVCDKILFAGDSLGATNPINGGGIFTSMSLGILAAEAVWLENPKIYSERSWNEVGSILLIGRAYRKLVDFFFEHWKISHILRIVNDSLAARVIKGERTILYDILSLGIRTQTSGQPR
ncbi:MAG: NAD(P)/FAD-dependent oxidoreductase [Infirmifilum sp.]